MAQEWGEQPLDFNQEPRKVFVNFLIWDLKLVQTVLFIEHKPLRAIRPLMGLINTLDEKSQKALAKQYEEFEKYYANVSRVTSDDIYRIYRKVAAYLHETYLKEMQLARPMRPSKGFTEVPKF